MTSVAGFVIIDFHIRFWSGFAMWKGDGASLRLRPRPGERQRCLLQFILPTAAEGFDELNGRDQALAFELGVGALGLQRFTAGIHDLEVTDNAGAIAVG